MKTRGIHFERLTLLEALDLAILIEEEARERYEELASQMTLHHNEQAAEFFRFMAKNEEKHWRELVQRRRSLDDVSPPMVRREQIFDIEAPEYDAARATMSARQALQTALSSEQKAWEFFLGAQQVLTDPKVRALFGELCKEELVHQDWVKAELAKLGPDDPFDPDDFGDEPVGHD